MTKFKIGDKVRLLKNQSVAINHETNEPFKKKEGIEMSKKVYTEDDIYEGMVLECVKSGARYWEVGKKYIVDKLKNNKHD